MMKVSFAPACVTPPSDVPSVGPMTCPSPLYVAVARPPETLTVEPPKPLLVSTPFMYEAIDELPPVAPSPLEWLPLRATPLKSNRIDACDTAGAANSVASASARTARPAIDRVPSWARADRTRGCCMQLRSLQSPFTVLIVVPPLKQAVCQ